MFLLYISIYYFFQTKSFIFIFCQNSNFLIKGTITLYGNSLLSLISCPTKCSFFNDSDIDNNQIYNFNFNISSLDLSFKFRIESSNNMTDSLMGAKMLAEIINDNNEICSKVEITNGFILINHNSSKEYLRLNNQSFLYYQLPEDAYDNKYEILFISELDTKYTCESKEINIKPDEKSLFTLSSLIINKDSIKSQCCNFANITFMEINEGFLMENNESIPLYSSFDNPKSSEFDQIFQFSNNKIGCYYLKYKINQQNFNSEKNCYRAYVICYKSCENCYDCDGNINVHKCDKCAENHYRKRDDSQKDNCYTEDEKNMNFPNYYLDKNSNFFEKCFYTCGKCRISGNNYKHKCDSCAEGFYPTEGNEYLSNCYNEENKPMHYYFNSTKKIYTKCYHTCSKCFGYGNKFNNNCEECIKNHHFYINEPGNCIMEGEQPNNYYLDKETNFYRECYYTCNSCNKYKNGNSQGCLSCNQNLGYYLIVDQPGNCVQDAPEYYLNTYNSENKIFEKCNINYCAECSDGEWYFVSNYTGYTFYCYNKTKKMFFNMQIFKQYEPIFNESQSVLNSINIKNCENRLRDKRKLRKTEEIIIVKKDYINSMNHEIEFIEYFFYKKKSGLENNFSISKLMDISLCDELDIFISIPRNLINYYNSSYLFTVKKAYTKFNYDLFNDKDPFYNDFCTQFYINNSDLTLKDRITLYLQNNLCPKDCLYHSLKYKKSDYFADVNCNCNKFLNSKKNYSPIKLVNNYFVKNNSTNIAILKCFKSFLKSFKFQNFNISHLLYLLIIISYIFILIYFCIIDNNRFRARIYESLNNCKSILTKYEVNDTTLLNQKMELYDKNKSKLFYTKIYSLNEPIININDISYRISKVEDNRAFFSIFYSNLLDINFIFRVFCLKSQYEILSLSICVFIQQINTMLIFNSIIFFDDIISYKYIYNKFPFEKIVINVILLLIVNYLLCKFVYKYVFIKGKLMEFFIEEYNNQLIYFNELHNVLVSKYKKIIIIFIIIFLFLLFAIYYNIIFCFVFLKTQTLWFEQFIFFKIFNIMIDIFFALVITIIRIIALKMKNIYLYNTSLIIKSIFKKY